MTGPHPTETLERAIKPAARWRNRWWASQPIEYANGVFGPGEYLSTRIFASKDLAETCAANLFVRYAGWVARNEARGTTVKYLGAEPVPEAA